jgi:hypothetical protein
MEYGNRTNPDYQYVDITGYQDFEEVLLNRKPQTAWVTIHIRYGVKFDPNKTPPPEEKITTTTSKAEKRTHLIDIAGEDLSTDSNSSDSQSDSHTRLSKSELTRSLKKKAQRKLTRLKAKKERARLRARVTVTSRQCSELEFAVASLTGRHLWEYKIQQRWRCTRTQPLCRNLHGTCWEYPVMSKHFVVGKTDLIVWAKEAENNVLDGNVENPPYDMQSKWTQNKNMVVETRRQNTISTTPSTSFDTMLSGTSILGNPNYPSIHITLSPQFINNSGSITSLPQLNTTSK